MMTPYFKHSLLLCCGFAMAATLARAEIVVVANENKVRMGNGVLEVLPNPASDNITILDLAGGTPRVVAEVPLPFSMIGPPLSVAVTPDEGLALVTAANKIDPANPAQQIPDNRMTVVDLKASPPRVIATLETGLSPSGVAVNRQGTLALVANRSEGSISVFEIRGKSVTAAGKVAVADAAASVNHAIFTADGRRALVSRDGDHMLTLLNVDGSKVTLANRNLRSGFKPYGADVSPDGSMAVVSNVGFVDTDVDTIGVIDLRSNPPRAVEIVPVGETPEAVRLSPDGRWCAVVLIAGSNTPKESETFAPRGKLVVLRVDGLKLTRVAEAPIGGWPQGVAFSADSRTILASNMVERNIQVFRWDGTTLRDTGQPLKMNGGPAALRTAK
jgi:DNA-binding beta-propeller fold protein YncE